MSTEKRQGNKQLVILMQKVLSYVSMSNFYTFLLNIIAKTLFTFFYPIANAMLLTKIIIIKPRTVQKYLPSTSVL